MMAVLSDTVVLSLIVAIACLGICLYLLVIHNQPHLTACKPTKPLGRRAATVPGVILTLLVTGPPLLRERNPLASIEGQIDLVVILQVLVWGVAGLWVTYLLFCGRSEGRRYLPLYPPQKLALVLILCLGLSALNSPAPALTAFKVYQMFVAFLFGSLFVQLFGIEVCLRKLFIGYTVLCLAIGVAFFVAPDVVLHMPKNWQAYGLRGDLIAPTGTVSAFAIILLLTTESVRTSRTITLALFGLFGTLLVFSRTRAAYIAIVAFFVLAIARRPTSKAVRAFVAATLAAVPVLLITGLIPGIVQWAERDPESISTLSDRFGLWTYFSTVIFNESPWIGLGYFAAGRLYGMKYNANMGQAHSVFMEVLIGGGIVSVVIFTLLWFALFFYAAHILVQKNDEISFAASSLLVSVFVLTAVGWGELSSGPAGVTFWCLVSILPALWKHSALFTQPQQRCHQ